MQSVTALTLKNWLDTNEAVLIDVREPSEYRSAHIKEATLLPLGSLHPDDLPEFTGRKLVIQCHLGGRSAAACHLLAKALPDAAIYNLEGGIDAWAKAGLPVE